LLYSGCCRKETCLPHAVPQCLSLHPPNGEGRFLSFGKQQQLLPSDRSFLPGGKKQGKSPAFSQQNPVLSPSQPTTHSPHRGTLQSSSGAAGEKTGSPFCKGISSLGTTTTDESQLRAVSNLDRAWGERGKKKQLLPQASQLGKN